MNGRSDMPSDARALRLLALGTSTDWCSVALLVRDAHGQRVTTRAERAGPRQSRVLMPMATDLLAAEGLGFDALGAVAFDAGPGAFTGLRIGCGSAQGLGFALAVPVIPIGSLEALALHAGAERAFCVIDARMNEVYCAGFRLEAGLPVAIGPVRTASALAPEALLARWAEEGGGDPAAAVAVGDAFIRHPLLAEQFVARGFRVAPLECPEAEAIARLAAVRLDQGQGMHARDVAPYYVRDKVALDVDEQRRLRAARAAVAPSSP